MSKTKKRLIIVCSIVGVLVVLGVIFGALFSVRRISVDFATAINRFENTTAFQNQVIEASKIKNGNSIIFTDFDKVEDRLEKAYPYGRFEIVRNFPDKVIIYIYERTPVFKVDDEQGFSHIYDEDLKLLDIVPTASLSDEFAGLEIPPSISGFNLELCNEEGDFMTNPSFKAKYTAILDGVYGAHQSPISIMSDIVLAFDSQNNYNTLTFTFAGTGTKLVIQGDNYLKEKIAYGVHTYLSSIRQDNYYSSILDVVTITVYNDFVPGENMRLIVSPVKPE